MTANRIFRLICLVSGLFLLHFLSAGFTTQPAYMADIQKLDFWTKNLVLIYQMLPFLLVSGLIRDINIYHVIHYRSKLEYFNLRLAQIFLLFGLFIAVSYLLDNLGGDFLRLFLANAFLLAVSLAWESFVGLGASLAFLAFVLNLGLYFKLGFFSFISLTLRNSSVLVLLPLAVGGIVSLLVVLQRKDILL